MQQATTTQNAHFQIFVPAATARVRTTAVPATALTQALQKILIADTTTTTQAGFAEYAPMDTIHTEITVAFSETAAVPAPEPSPEDWAPTARRQAWTITAATTRPAIATCTTIVPTEMRARTAETNRNANTITTA